ncbi:MAG: DUF433 domain-containing protein [Cyanobacteria bacterium K_Offshore_surface_m2_239]|nr:DUF433 domain-containing protein [Cyanobacteria bacterium K_Offshore_surface_m2_239]
MPTQADLGWTGCPAVERVPLRVSGARVFRGTRIPVAALFENLKDGVSLSEFVELFPGVTVQQARQVLEHLARSTRAAVGCGLKAAPVRPGDARSKDGGTSLGGV